MDFFTSSGPERCNSNPDRNTNPDENTNPSAKKGCVSMELFARESINCSSICASWTYFVEGREFVLIASGRTSVKRCKQAFIISIMRHQLLHHLYTTQYCWSSSLQKYSSVFVSCSKSLMINFQGYQKGQQVLSILLDNVHLFYTSGG